MGKMGPDLLTTEELRQRWKKNNRKTIWRMAKQYNDVLQPMKIGRELLFDPANVKKFEEQMRVVS